MLLNNGKGAKVMEYKIDHDLHIHTYLSECSQDPKQTPKYILEYAKKNGLNTVAVTDHYWDGAVPTPSNWYRPQNFDNLAKCLPLPSSEGIKFLFGCETDMNWDFTIGIPKERFDDFGFIIVPTTHLQMSEFTIHPEDAESDEARARLWVERFDKLLSADLPFYKTGVAHLACPLINNGARDREKYLSTLDLIPSGEMERLFAKAKEVGIGIELNKADMRFSDSEAERVLRMFRIAKWQGCKFYLGTDAHHPKNFENAKEIFERAINMLGLEESDKFEVCKL